MNTPYSQNRANNFNVYGEFSIKQDIDITPITYNLQTMSTPSITLGSSELSYNGKRGTIPGDTITKDDSISLRFILDENLQVLFNLTAIQEYNLGKSSEDVFTMMIHNNMNIPIARAEYTKVWIQSISSVEYDITQEETTMYVDVQMSFLDFSLTSLI